MQHIKRQISHLAKTISLDLAMGNNVHNANMDDVSGNASQGQIADVVLQNLTCAVIPRGFCVGNQPPEHQVRMYLRTEPKVDRAEASARTKGPGYECPTIKPSVACSGL